MADQVTISSILAALTAQQTVGTPVTTFQSSPNVAVPGMPPMTLPGYGVPAPAPAPAASFPSNLGNFSLPPPSNRGALDLSNVKPAGTGNVSIDEAIAKARGIAAQRGLNVDARGGPVRDLDARPIGRPFRRSRSRSRSPLARRDNFRDNYNPYRDERRDDRRGRDFRDRDRSFSPGPRNRRGGYSPPPSRGSGGGRGDRTPPRGRRGGGGGLDDDIETLPIDSNLVGLIIGRQGENLRRVEADSGCRVQFITGPENSGPTRTCKLTGSRQARMNAKNELHRIIEENGRPGSSGGPPMDRDRDRGDRGDRDRRGTHQPALRDGEDSVQIMVPDRTVGLIIGRGGETIRDLEERSKCHVNVVGESKAVNGLRPVNLIGSVQAANKAKELIMEIVESDAKVHAAQEAQARNAAAATAGRDHDHDRGRPQERERERETPVMSGRGGGGQHDQGRRGGSRERINDTMRVPSDSVGMIIGKGGENIKEMQNMTGCKINVSQFSAPGEMDREVGLVGTRDAIERAKMVIEDKVDAVRQLMRGGGGGAAPSMIDSYRGGRGRSPREERQGPPPHQQHQQQNQNHYQQQQHQPSQQQQQHGWTQGGQQQQGGNQQQAQTYSTSAAASPAATTTPATVDPVDPYAAYGGYNNYLAIWYAAVAAQQQAQLPPGQGQTQPGQPGQAGQQPQQATMQQQLQQAFQGYGGAGQSRPPGTA
ncbi:MAG: hypothetical protein M1823_003439 [Watsoniomyces obsoletus]|nr:MAG: hypothetical protein M1823_003439 [Watsoniomyces obsoletus]